MWYPWWLFSKAFSSLKMFDDDARINSWPSFICCMIFPSTKEDPLAHIRSDGCCKTATLSRHDSKHSSPESSLCIHRTLLLGCQRVMTSKVQGLCSPTLSDARHLVLQAPSTSEPSSIDVFPCADLRKSMENVILRHSAHVGRTFKPRMLL